MSSMDPAAAHAASERWSQSDPRMKLRTILRKAQRVEAAHQRSAARAAPAAGLVQDGVRSMGSLIFKSESRRAKASAKFAVVQDYVAAERLCDVLETSWALKRPSVLLSITGSAVDMRLDSSLEQRMKHGLADAARASNAWVFTGGTDCGVMALTSLALRDVGSGWRAGQDDGGQTRTPCIGVAPYRKVTHREKLVAESATQPIGLPSSPEPTNAPSAAPSAVGVAAPGAAPGVATADGGGAGGAGVGGQAAPNYEMEVLYVKRKPNSMESAALDPNHTHFILVDNGKDEYGGEIQLRGSIEQALSERFRVPSVLLVVQGGLGTYATVRRGTEIGQRVVLVKESRGAAQVIAEYIEPLLPEADHLVTLHPDELEKRLKLRDSEFASRMAKLNRKLDHEAVTKALHKIAERLDLFSVFSVFDERGFDVTVLQAIVASFKSSNQIEANAREKRKLAKTLETLKAGAVKQHMRARGPHPQYPPRGDVPDAKVPWETPWKEYEEKVRVPHTAPSVAPTDGEKPDWADADLPFEADEYEARSLPFGDDFVAELSSRVSFEVSMAEITLDEFKRPLNPRGRTGIEGRGLLGRWGPSHAADAIVTRFTTRASNNKRLPIQILQMVAVQRRDTKELALPGGMVKADVVNEKSTLKTVSSPSQPQSQA